MENTPENKAKFFGLYLKQKVVFKPDWECFNDKSLMELDPVYLQTGNHVLTAGYLLLTPLSQITDEHLIELGKIYDYWQLDPDVIEKEAINNFRSHLLNQAFDWDYTSIYNALDLADFLRSKGYALPFMGLSVEQLVKYGWVQLKAA